MPNIRNIIEFSLPELILEGTPWYKAWIEQHRRLAANRKRIFFTLCFFTYLGHYFFVDVPRGKEPLELWFAFRVSMAVICIGCVFFYSKPRVHSNSLFIWPAIVAMSLGCFFQAYVSVYFPEAPWIYPYIFCFSSVLVLGVSPMQSLAFAIPLMLSFIPPLTTAGVPLYQLVSATFVCGIVILVVRTAYISDIRNFLLTQERDESRGEVIKLGKEYENRLKSFIPRVIVSRIQMLMDERKKSALEATVDVLQPVKKHVACLWSDIRGFTQASNDLDEFLFESVVPEVKVSSDAIETYHGIPRKIGDLIFAYFDHPKLDCNVLRVILAGYALSELNKDRNETVSSINIKRYILISTGEAIVGNVGGFNSGVEITALGPPVNFLARLDDATKLPGLSKMLAPGDLLLCENTAKELLNIFADIPICPVDLEKVGVSIRDFPEVQRIYVLKPSEKIRDEIVEYYSNNVLLQIS